MIGSLSARDVKDLWQPSWGLDAEVRDWIYPTVSGLAIASHFAPMSFAPTKRYQIASALTFGTCVLAVYFIFYLTWTPVDVD